MTIDKIILAHNDAFISSEKKDLNFGFTDDAIWLRFSVINTNPTITQWMMMISYYFLWEIDLYIIQGDQIIDHKKSGYIRTS
ncbi:Diverse 7TM receptor, extracellular region 2 domain protein [Candidatus Magnetomorum sp. HK-1]|nr:Diverse 7TM receptor, extracellular region 2 domain protein [Candidatus Magnetomorum sp. HK-1]